jgi:hypothetical protein
MICEAFSSVLRSGRPEFNARFAEARRLYPDLEINDFLSFLNASIDPVIQAVVKVQPEKAGDVVNVSYDMALALVGQKLAGLRARQNFIESGWNRIFTANASLVAASPQKVFASVSNALHQLAATPGTRPEQWISEMQEIAPQCGDVETFLRAGQIIAWRSGLAHFRHSCILAADLLPSTIALKVMRLPASGSWPDLKKGLLANPWFNPWQNGSDQSREAPSIRAVAEAGSFRGYGGLFTVPPIITSQGENFLVRSGDECWLLTADILGATFHRATMREFEDASSKASLPSGLKIKGSEISWGGKWHKIPRKGGYTSAAASATTLALTSSITHRVLFIALI